MLSNHEFIIFGVDNYNALGVLRGLGEKGLKATLIAKDIKGRCRVAYKSRYVKEYYRVDSFEEGYDILLKYGNPDCKPFVITDDDKAQAFIDEHYNDLKDSFYTFNCNGHDMKDYMNKYRILEVAESVGIKILKTTTIYKNEEIPDNLEYPVITKSISPIVGGWKKDSFICHNKEELAEVMKIIKSDPVVIQKFLDKENEYCIDGYCINHGEDIRFTFATMYNYIIQGYYSPYMTVSDVIPELYDKMKELFKVLQYDGIFCLEFLIDKEGNYYFLEVNFRNSAWAQIGVKLDRNLPISWAEATLAGKIEKEFPYSIPENYTAMVEPIDYQKRVVERGYSRLKWFIDFCTTNCKFYFSIKDLKPFLHMVRNNKKLR